MANEKLELTLSGLCVLVIEGKEGDPPKGVQALLVDATKATSAHIPRLSFRAIDLQKVDGLSDKTPVDIEIGDDGWEIISIEIPPAATISASWEGGSVAKAFSVSWEADAPASMYRVPALHDFNVQEVHLDKTNTAATLAGLPYGTIEARNTVRNRDGDLYWAFGTANTGRPYANQVALVTEGKNGMSFYVEVKVKKKVTTYTFLSKDLAPLRIALTNLPKEGKIVEPEIEEGESPHHLHSYKKIAKKEKDPGFRLFKRVGKGSTRQGSICPPTRFHKN